MIPSSKNFKDSGSPRVTWLPTETITVWAVLISLCFGIERTAAAGAGEPDQAAWNSWYRYENDFFVAYSNARNRQARKILEDLEYFRAAALRVPDIDLPGYMQKTLVIIPATEAQYLELAENKNSVGFAQPLAERTAIVFPATSRTEKSKYILHHEYAHALAHGNLSDYPQWYVEGFAEIASSVVIHKHRMSFYVGMHEGRWPDAREPRIDWNELISDEFDAHSFSDVRVTASAYAQFWLLAHFLIMSGEGDYLKNLERYFTLIENGETSINAFTSAFGLTPNELWEQELQEYLWRIPEYRHGFSESSLDRSFDRVPATAAEVEPMLKFFTDKAAMSRGMDATANPLSFITGKWDHLKFSDQCSEILTFRLRNGADVLVMDDFYAAESGTRVPAIFTIRHDYSSELILRNITSLQYPEISVTPDYQLTIRGEDVLCFDEVPAKMLCQSVLHRCE